jgi:hypothetical protein
MRLEAFTGPDGQSMLINPESIISIREPRGTEGHFHNDVKCLIFTSDGKFLAVTEDFDTVCERLET